MESVLIVFQFILDLMATWLQFFMNRWVTAIFIIGAIFLLVINLIDINDKK